MKTLSIVLNGLCALIFVDAVFSWINPDATEFPRSATSLVTGPLYAPIHAVLDPAATGGIDLAPLVWLIALQVIERSLRRRGRREENPFR